MKLIPLLTAIVVTVFLYFLVVERDDLLAFANAEENASVQTASGTAQPATESSDAQSAAIRVSAMRSTARQIDSAVILRGETEAARQVDVRAETSGQVISEPLRKGAFVTQGQLLCKIDPGTRDASLAEAKARLSEARARVPEAEARVPEAQARLDEAMARLDEAKININAASKLNQGGFASETRVAAAQAAVRAAEAAVASAKSGLQSTQAG
ncbi:MAG: efflux RND transporter periplasmic adaptor subunit, partial [Pseudomonadota bacterium]